MPGSLSYDHSRTRKTYMAPTGIDPTVYMHELNAQAEAFCREGDYHAALRLLQKRLAVVSYYRGSRTVHAAQAMAKLAAVTRETGNERDAHAWAYYAMRAYAALMMDNEAPHKQHIAESLALLDRAYPSLLEAGPLQVSGVPDFTSGQLRHPIKPVTEEHKAMPLPQRTDLTLG